METNLDGSSATIAWKTSGATAAVFPGAQSILLHCTKNVNTGAADRPGIRPPYGPAIEIEGHVFVEKTGHISGFGNLEFGMVQISTLFAYDVLYVGRVPSEGSTVIDLRQAFTTNPSVDVEPGTGESVEDHVFSPANVFPTPAFRPDGRKGLDIKVTATDNPWNLFDLTFENRVAGAPNFIAKVARNEAFVTHFVVREPGAPTTILARLGWTVNWYAEFNWVAGRPFLSAHTCLLFPGVPRIGAPPPDPISTLAVTLAGKTTNELDNEATDARSQRRQPICMQLRERPSEFRSNFYQ